MIGHILRFYRERQNLTQQDIANTISVSQNDYWKMENNKVMPSAKHIPKLAEALHIEEKVLLHPEGNIYANNTTLNDSSIFYVQTLQQENKELLTKLEDSYREIIKAKDETIAALKASLSDKK